MSDPTNPLTDALHSLEAAVQTVEGAFTSNVPDHTSGIGGGESAPAAAETVDTTSAAPEATPAPAESAESVESDLPAEARVGEQLAQMAERLRLPINVVRAFNADRVDSEGRVIHPPLVEPEG